MTEFTISIAGKRVKICAVYPYAKQFCENYLDEGEANFTVVMNDELIEFEREKSIRECISEGREPCEYDAGYLETLAIYRKISEKMLEYNAFLFHGSAVCVHGNGYLFTAKSGTGKSTHTKLWRYGLGRRCVFVNDDKPLLMVTEDGVMVCGTPWDGKHRRSTNIVVPLKGIAILERGQDNVITPIDASTALPLMLQQCYRPSNPTALAKTLSLLEHVMNKVSLYRLECTISLDAAKVAYECMKQKG